MKKVKRITLISKGKGFVKEMFGINQRRIERALTSASDKAEEESINADDKVLNLLNDLSEATGDSEKVCEIINNICDTLDAKEDWLRKKDQINKVKALLEEEVEVED